MTTRGTAAYRTVAAELRDAIRDGQFNGGRQMPTESDLEVRYGVGRQTIRRAFQELVAEGLVVRTPGRGSFAVESDGRYLRQFGSVDDLMAFADDSLLEVVQPLQRQIDLEAASRLRLDSDIVHQVVFRRLFGETAFCLTTASLPPAIAEQLADSPELTTAYHRSRSTVIGVLEKYLSIVVTDADQSITAVRAEPEVSDAIGCQPGDAILRIDRLYLDRDGLPIELAVGYFAPQHYSYRVQLRRRP